MTTTAPATTFRRSTTEGIAAAGGVAWVLGITLVATQADSDPVGSGYDAANRALLPALGLLTASAFRRWQESGRRADAARAIGLGLALLGSLLEFWVVWALGGSPDATAARTGEEGSVLSPVGFGLFLVGMLVQLGGGVGRATHRALPTAARVASVVAAVALVASTAVWAVGPAPAAVVAAVAAVSWWIAARGARLDLGAQDG